MKEKEAKKALARVSRDRFREFLQEKKEQGVITAISRSENTFETMYKSVFILNVQMESASCDLGR